ncbi:MAG: hypothetical protein ACPG7F_21235, partial [Aggregatilineales bacterium]
MQDANSQTPADSRRIERVDNLNQQALDFKKTDPTKIQGVAQEALNLAESIGYQYGIAMSSILLGRAALIASDYPLVYTYATTANNIFIALGNEKKQIDCLHLLITL